ncbi:Ficolin-1 [Pseudolycoriella hygida]|uniref:Ficolin-1 n=1 Tax=Pseudolycoriella hygida TaxID=35572 RepID=A0A9Q0NFY6_9DIPT|nr:Ficolin-1 [Pseudolycoriella hygida]
MNKALLTIILLSGIFAVCYAVNEPYCTTVGRGSDFNDCDDALAKGFTRNGVYLIRPKSSLRPFEVWCDMESDDGGWTIIQARFDGLIDFFRTWADYRNGFGCVDSEHWLGNNFIHHITKDNNYELRIELTGFKENEFAVASYSPFRIGSEDEKYKLYVGNFTGIGDIVDRLSQHNGYMFTTKDSDNDVHSYNCAESMKGAWWYTNCYWSNLNGVWMSQKKSMLVAGSQSNANVVGMNYRDAFKIQFYSLKSVEMKKVRGTILRFNQFQA